MALLCFSTWMVAQEAEPVQDTVATDTVRIKGIHPWKLSENEPGVAPKTAHWSLIPHFGFSAFDGDFVSEQKHNVAVPSVGVALEYNFTPVWSFGVEYMYDMYTVTGKGDQYTVDTLLTGHMHKAGAYLSIDVINLFFPRAHKKIVSIFPYIGAGGAWYKRARYYMDNKYYDAYKGVWVNPTHGRGNTVNYVNADGNVGPEHDDSYNMLGYIQSGINIDFNLNRTLALGLRANYTYFTRDYVDGRGYHRSDDGSSFASKNNDGIFDITANLRIKFEAVSKSHVRNMTSFAVFDKMLEEEKPIAMGHDTVIIRHDSIIVREVVKQLPRKEVFNVYFDNDKSVLKSDGLIVIQQVAERMETEPDLYAVVIGYCDNTGKNEHNFELGDKRADVVIDELEKQYNIPADHLYGKGGGKLVGLRQSKAYGPNRRSAIHLVDRETFELMKMQLEDKSAERDANAEPTFDSAKPIYVPVIVSDEDKKADSIHTVALEESARKEKINQYVHRKHETIVVEKGTTLSRLARTYYDNTQCWVYIYMANRDNLASPSDLQEGKEIIIPELTKEELQITTAECLRLYSIAAHNRK